MKIMQHPFHLPSFTPDRLILTKQLYQYTAEHNASNLQQQQ